MQRKSYPSILAMSGVISKGGSSRIRMYNQKGSFRMVAGSAKTVAVNAQKRVSRLQRKIARETDIKAVDQLFNTTVDNTASITHLTPVAQGDSNSERDGNVIFPKAISARILLNINPASAVNNFARLMLVQDKASNGVAPTLASILASTGQPITSPLNVANKARFWIHFDRTYALSVGDQDAIVDKFYKKLRKMRTTYIGSTALVASAGTNQLYLVLISDQTATLPSFQVYTRVKYAD